MKKQICYALILCLFVSLFAGCTEKQPVTSTDVTPLESDTAQTQELESNQEGVSLEQTQLEQEDNDQSVQTSQAVTQTVEVESTQKQSSTQSVAQQPQKELNKEVSGTPAGPLVFRSGDVLGEFKKWIETVPLMPDDVQAGSEAYYYYLKPEFQEMLLDDRYYLLPTAPKGYTLDSIWVSAPSISFVYKDQAGVSADFNYFTMKEQLPTTLSSQNQKFVEFSGVQYLQTYSTPNDGTTELKLQRNYDKYTISITCDNVGKTGITPEQVANLFTFTEVDLPPLKAVIQ